VPTKGRNLVPAPAGAKVCRCDAGTLQSYLDASNALDDYEFATGEHVVDIALATVVEPDTEAA